ncbi:hypothetical protein BN1708_011661 [Verticillium longisporum]|uniref:Uncharacterized protein n=1 Tax=Verticillium longisporum TaxID=100787 RepID=A0A0G4L2B8_VERLO|nr:hypothetical protein BN1708_011661 [Verticillium longisporum]
MPDFSQIMNNPMFASMAQNLMSNPDMMNNLMSNPRLREMADSFGSGGGMPDLGSLMQDPNIADMARNMMGGQGPPGAGGAGGAGRGTIVSIALAFLAVTAPSGKAPVSCIPALSDSAILPTRLTLLDVKLPFRTISIFIVGLIIMGVIRTLLGLVQCCLPLNSYDVDSAEDERQPLLARDGTYIVVLHHGRIIEQGSHEKLLASMGRYASLWATKEPGKQNEASCPRYSDRSTSTEPKAMLERTITASPIKTPQRHRREGSKLNPDAPEFTPGALAAARSNPSPFINRVETPTPAQRTTTPLPENIALPPSAAPVIRADFRFPLVSPRRRFQSKSETNEYGSDECATPRRVSAPSPSRTMRDAPRETEKLGCGRVHDDQGPVVVEKDKPESQHVITINTIKPAASPPAKSSTNHAQSPHCTAPQRGTRDTGRFSVPVGLSSPPVPVQERDERVWF